MQSNRMTAEVAAENWELPLEAIEEIERYCASNRDLIGTEADEEKLALQDSSVYLAAGTRA
jgi:hypothetical protein